SPRRQGSALTSCTSPLASGKARPVAVTAEKRRVRNQEQFIRNESGTEGPEEKRHPVRAVGTPPLLEELRQALASSRVVAEENHSASVILCPSRFFGGARDSGG